MCYVLKSTIRSTICEGGSPLKVLFSVLEKNKWEEHEHTACFLVKSFIDTGILESEIVFSEISQIYNLQKNKYYWAIESDRQSLILIIKVVCMYCSKKIRNTILTIVCKIILRIDESKTFDLSSLDGYELFNAIDEFIFHHSKDWIVTKQLLILVSSSTDAKRVTSSSAETFLNKLFSERPKIFSSPTMSQNIFITDYVSDDYFCEYSDNARDCKEVFLTNKSIINNQ
jgi:hypothetical protein